MVTKKIQQNWLVLFIDEEPLNNQSNSFLKFSSQINLQSYQSPSKLKMSQLKEIIRIQTPKFLKILLKYYLRRKVSVPWK